MISEQGSCFGFWAEPASLGHTRKLCVCAGGQIQTRSIIEFQEHFYKQTSLWSICPDPVAADGFTCLLLTNVVVETVLFGAEGLMTGNLSHADWNCQPRSGKTLSWGRRFFFHHGYHSPESITRWSHNRKCSQSLQKLGQKSVLISIFTSIVNWRCKKQTKKSQLKSCKAIQYNKIHQFTINNHIYNIRVNLFNTFKHCSLNQELK